MSTNIATLDHGRPVVSSSLRRASSRRAARRGIASAFVGTAFALGPCAPSVEAAGPPVDRFDGIYATCEGLGEIFAVSLPANDHARLVPTFVLDGGQVLVPVSYVYRLTFTPTGGEPQTWEQSASRRAPANATIDTCVAQGTQITDEGTYQLYLAGMMVVHP